MNVFAFAYLYTSISSILHSGIMFTLRMIGPTLGYALGAIFMRMHVNITETTTLKPTDPSWIGAWWLGKRFALISSTIFLIN